MTRTGNNLAGGVTVGYQVVGGTAVNGTDYTLANGTLTFTAGQTSARINIPLTDDAIFQGDLTVLVQLVNPQGGAKLFSPATSVGTLTIVDNEQSVQFSLSSYTVTEGGVATINVVRSGPTDAVATVQFATVAGAAGGGTATAGSDYLATSGTLTFDVGQTVASFTVTTVQDAVFESNETVILQLSNPAPAGVLLGSRSQATLTIVNDDQRVRFSTTSYSVAEGSVGSLLVLREGPPNGTITVNFATISGGTATAGSDYKPVSGTLTFGPGVVSQTISVGTLRDPLREGNETVGVQLSSPSKGVTLGTPNLAVLTIVDSPF